MKVSSHTGLSNICVVTAGDHVIIRFCPIGPRRPINTHHSPGECWIFLPQVEVSSTRLCFPSPWGWFSLSGKKKRRVAPHSAVSCHDLRADLLLHHVSISSLFLFFLSCSTLLLFLPNPNDREWAICREELETEACLFPVLWVNICLVLCNEKKKAKETVVLMLLEQLPARMTKPRLKLSSPRLDSHECWEIVL